MMSITNWIFVALAMIMYLNNIPQSRIDVVVVVVDTNYLSQTTNVCVTENG